MPLPEALIWLINILRSSSIVQMFSEYNFDCFHCRRHRCPHRPTNVINKGDQPCVLSEYKNVYREHPHAMRAPFKPAHEALQGGNFEDRTTNR